MANWKIAPPTRPSSDSRSSALAGLATGGHANSFGMTDHSLASSSGTAMIPTTVCSDWLSANSQAGRVGQLKISGWKSWSRGTIALRPRSGL